MPTRFLEHVSVWIDDPATSVVTFSHAMQWAQCLGLPLRVTVASARPAHDRKGETGCPRTAVDQSDSLAASYPSLVETLQAWSAACSDVGIVLETCFWLTGTDVGMAQLLRPWGLCVLAACQYERFRQDLLARCGHSAVAALLLCPPRSTPVRRIAVLCEHANPNAVYLETAAHVCQTLGVRPLVVTVARTARGESLRRSHAQGVCAALNVAADFDGIVASNPNDARIALGQLLESAQCSHLVIERTDGAAWPHLHRDWLAPWRRLSDALSILSLPETTALDIPQRFRPDRATAGHRDSAPFRDPFSKLNNVAGHT